VPEEGLSLDLEFREKSLAFPVLSLRLQEKTRPFTPKAQTSEIKAGSFKKKARPSRLKAWRLQFKAQPFKFWQRVPSSVQLAEADRRVVLSVMPNDQNFQLKES